MRHIRWDNGLRARVEHANTENLEIEVEIATLDSFSIFDIDLSKIDCEGAELTIFGGCGSNN